MTLCEQAYEPQQNHQIRWAVIVGTRQAATGRVVVETEIAESAREKVE
jgi:hypothetical protein